MPVPIAERATDALRRWLDHAGIYSGPIFRRIRRSGHIEETALWAQSVALILKRR